jgi:hypothetical protein
VPNVLTVPLQPCEAYRGADEDGCEAERDHRGAVEGDNAPHDASESLGGKDLQIEKQELDLDEAEERKVGELADPEVLARREHIGRRRESRPMDVPKVSR